jgi:hypothetical protein
MTTEQDRAEAQADFERDERARIAEEQSAAEFDYHNWLVENGYREAYPEPDEDA